jgi:cytidylate kinase
MALGPAPRVLRVLVTASITTRVGRLVSSGTGLSEEDAIAALDEDDRRRSEYFARFYDVSEELPTHYDVVINTDALVPEQVVTTIVTVARQ